MKIHEGKNIDKADPLPDILNKIRTQVSAV